jgi:hypothetical protein
LRKIQAARQARGRRRIGAPVSILGIAVAAVTTVAVTGAFAAGSGATGPALNRQMIAQHILSTQAAQVMTAPAQAALLMLAAGSKELSPGLPAHGLPTPGPSGPASSAGNLAKPAFTNVRVNDPSLDTHEPDQTTQSEMTIAVAGSHVAVGYNDSQQTGPWTGTTRVCPASHRTRSPSPSVTNRAPFTTADPAGRQRPRANLPNFLFYDAVALLNPATWYSSVQVSRGGECPAFRPSRYHGSGPTARKPGQQIQRNPWSRPIREPPYGIEP